MDYQHSRNKVYLMNYHLVWCPKRRKKVLQGDIKTRFEEIIQEVCKEQKVKILAMEVMPDHLHLFVSSHPDLHIHELIRRIKGRSARYLRKEYPELLKIPSLWTHSYFISTAGNVSSDTIRRYIAEQRKQ